MSQYMYESDLFVLDTKPLSDLLFKASNAYATDFEKNFDPTPYVNFAANNYAVVFTILCIYLLFLYGGAKYMSTRPAFDLRYPLAAWNGLLSIFSTIGMMRTVPHLVASILSQNYSDTVCTAPIVSWGKGTTGFWVMLFIFSKVPELIDTVFIILRKKPLIFLHWYHHVSVLLFCWNAYASIAGSGLYFVAMNYSVHALMYGYYCLQALHICPKSFPVILITMSQIGQMFVGTFVCVSAWYYMLSGKTCHNCLSNLCFGGVMYGSYLYLFVEFAVGRYGNRKGKPSAKKLD